MPCDPMVAVELRWNDVMERNVFLGIFILACVEERPQKHQRRRTSLPAGPRALFWRDFYILSPDGACALILGTVRAYGSRRNGDKMDMRTCTTEEPPAGVSRGTGLCRGLTNRANLTRHPLSAPPESHGAKL